MHIKCETFDIIKVVMLCYFQRIFIRNGVLYIWHFPYMQPWQYALTLIRYKWYKRRRNSYCSFCILYNLLLRALVKQHNVYTTSRCCQSSRIKKYSYYRIEAKQNRNLQWKTDINISQSVTDWPELNKNSRSQEFSWESAWFCLAEPLDTIFYFSILSRNTRRK